MGTRFSVERMERNSGDTLLFGVILVLLGLGLATLFSASTYYSEHLYGDPFRLVSRQAVWVVLGLLSAFVMYYIRIEVIKASAAILFAGAFLLTLLTFVPGIGKEIMGARRWIFLFGNSFQPSELVKVALIVYLSYLISKKEEEGDINDPLNSLLPLLISTALLVVPVYLQNDFSTSFFLFAIALVYLFLARVRLYYFISTALVLLPLGIILMLSKEYRVRRIMAFLDPEADPAGASYQIMASQSALVHGGLWGVGLGNSVKKLGGLPEAHSDFIFAVLGEEAGLIGVLFVIGLYVVFAVRGFRTAQAAESRFCFFLASGITATIVLQAFLNIAVVCGLVPATGITLPFFSSGGSSVLITLALCGLLLNISRNHQVQNEADYV